MDKNMNTGSIKVDFNNVRERLALNYNSLVRLLNSHRTNKNRHIEMPCYLIDDLMESLRMYVATVAMAYEEGREDFKDVLGENEIEIFNPFPEDEDE